MVVPAGTYPPEGRPARDDGMVPVIPPESNITGAVWRAPPLICTATVEIGDPEIVIPPGKVLTPNCITPADSLMSTPLFSRPGIAVTMELVPGNPLLGPIPKTPTAPDLDKNWLRVPGDDEVMTLTPVGKVVRPFPKLTVV